MSTIRSIRPARQVLGVLLASVLTVPVTRTAHAQQVGVSALPSAERIQWSDDFALTDNYLYGGRLALRFGKWVELQPFYFQRAGLGVDTTRASSVFGPLSAGRQVDLKHYGTSLQLNFAETGFIPFARVGAGVLRLEPDSAERQDRITVSAGGGVRFGVAGLNAELYAERMGFRMNPRSLFGTDTTGASLMTLRNLVYGAAVTIPLSTMREDEGNAGGLSGSTAPLEPFVGRLNYADEHNLPNLEVAGLRAGIDFSPVFGVRGFYWRGVNDDRDGPAPVAGYGGEAQFNLSTGSGLLPYLVVGAGQIDYKKDFTDSLGVPRVDKTAFILGAGASFRLTDRLRVNGAIRDYVMTVDDNLDNVASTGDLTHNTMITAGLTISFGGKSTPSMQQRERELAAERRALREERERNDRRREARERDGMREPARRGQRDYEPRVDRVREDSMRTERDSIVMSGRAPVVRPMVRRGTPEGQWITIPVPVQGEIILRYGVPPRTGAGDTATTRRMDSTATRRDTVTMPSAAPSTPPAGDLSAELRELERRLSARIDALQRSATAAPSTAPSGAPNVTVIAPRERTARDTVILDREATPVFERLQSTRARDLRPYVGLGFDDGDVQFILGSRADLGPVSPNSGWHFMPELAVGFGEGDLSVLAFANAQYAFGSIGGTTALRPYATIGAGVFSPTVLGINTAVGSSFALRSSNARPLFLNVELQGINLFNQTRILVGLSRSR